MAIVTHLHLIFISVSLLLLISFRGRLSNNQMKVIFIFFIFLSLFPVIFLAPTTQYYYSFKIFDKIILFLFIPACYIYILTNLYKQRPKKTNTFRLRFWTAKFTAYINPQYNSRHKIVRKYKDETKQPVLLNMSQERAIEIEGNIRNHFSRNKPFLKHGYSLRMLSEEVHLPLHQLSAFINSYYKKNFNDFVNEYRILSCIEKLLKKEWEFKKLESIAEESGFNNRNTFTSAFKKATGLNPSEFIKYIKLGKVQENKNPDTEVETEEMTKIYRLMNKLAG
ncbi:MAG: AraC family transcriptional regulator [Bacteroidetes bacterium]|nr:MAG: AraC family transcriptional regulator [Bacteroidota bacterium]